MGIGSVCLAFLVSRSFNIGSGNLSADLTSRRDSP